MPYGYTPMNYRPPQPFYGKRNEDWNEFKKRLIKMFQSIHLEDEQAADQFCTYLEGNAYRHWNSLPSDVQGSFPKVLSAFDKKFENNHRQGSWQIQYENMTYLGPDKETLDELATRIKDIVNKAYPDIIRKGVVHSKKEQRKSNARRKFWDLMPDNIQKQLFIKFGSCDAPLKQQLKYAQRIEASDLRARKGKQSYMQICAMEPQNNTATDALMQTVSTALNAVTQQNKELAQLVERQTTNNKQETKPPRKQNWQQPQQQQNWQPQQRNWQPQQQNWQPQQNNWQPQSQNWQQQQQNWQPQQQWQQSNTPQQTQPQTSQQSQEQTQQQQQPRQRPTCHFCKKIGHVKKHCRSNPESPNYGKFPPRQNQQNPQQNQQNQQTNQQQQGYKPNPPPEGQRYGINNNQQNNTNNHNRQGFLPSRSGHPQDLRERKAPMNAMPVQRVQQQQPFKPTVAACQEEEEFAFLNQMEFTEQQDSLN